ncbi:MAG: helix-turn-helix domain-containing protein [Oscillochloris sp.]|nr:helix-turn-helix domain-containing protein [Oscillochloris sp.]
MNISPLQLDLLVREVAQARGFRTPHALAEALCVTWNTASDLWSRKASRIGRDLLANICGLLSVEPYHLLRLVDKLPPPDELRQIAPLPMPKRGAPEQITYHISLHFRELAEQEYGIHDVQAFRRHVGVVWDTAALLWYDRGSKLNRPIIARALSTLGGSESLARVIMLESSTVAEPSTRRTDLAIPLLAGEAHQPGPLGTSKECHLL